MLSRMLARPMLVAAATLSVALAGCTSGTSLGPGGNTTGKVRAFNALICSNYNTLSFAQRISIGVIAPNVAYGQATGYTTVAAGNGLNDYALNGTTVVAQSSNTVEPNKSYTLIAAGDCTQAAGSTLAPTVIQITDTVPTAATLNGSAALRVVNVAATSAAGYTSVDLYNAGQPVTGLTNVTYGKATAYAILPAVNYNLTVHSHANNALLALSTSATTQLSSLTLQPNKAYTLFIIGSPFTGQTPIVDETFDAKLVTDN